MPHPLHLDEAWEVAPSKEEVLMLELSQLLQAVNEILTASIDVVPTLPQLSFDELISRLGLNEAIGVCTGLGIWIVGQWVRDQLLDGPGEGFGGSWGDGGAEAGSCSCHLQEKEGRMGINDHVQDLAGASHRDCAWSVPPRFTLERSRVIFCTMLELK